MADKKISQLDSTTSVNSDAMFPLSQLEGGNLKTVKGTVEQIGDYIAKVQDHSTLNTSSKKIIGAINEILAGSIEGTASGSVASFADGGDNIPVNTLTAEIDASVSGFTEVKVTRCGKNFWPFGDITASENDIPFSLKAGTYNLSGTRSGTGTPSISIRFYYADGTSTVCQLSGTNSYSNSVNLTADVVKINKYISADSLVNVQLEAGDEKTTYEAYKGNSYTIALDETLTQGGSLEVVSGLLTRTDMTTKQLTGVSIPTISGLNNIYANSGDVEVTYFTDKANEIAKLIETYMNL